MTNTSCIYCGNPLNNGEHSHCETNSNTLRDRVGQLLHKIGNLETKNMLLEHKIKLLEKRVCPSDSCPYCISGEYTGP